MIEPSLETQRAAEAALFVVQPVTLLHHIDPELHIVGSIKDSEELTLVLSQGTDVVILNFEQTHKLAFVLRDFFNA
jgi:hypothetical protein